ncbi:MAG: flagellin lysine-N-methylase [Rhodanobacter sp.]
MKPLIKKTMIVPRYVAQFRCIGGECPETCCAGWNISVDKQTFASYKTSSDTVLKPLLHEHLKRNRLATSDGQFGSLKLNPQSGHCGLQASDGLCQVQTRLGEDALSDTCHSYPRTTRLIDGQYEQALTLSCPEAARLALLSPDGFEFVAEPLIGRTSAVLKASHMPGFDDMSVYATRTWAMQLIHTRELSVTDRLAVLGLLCDQIDMLIRERRHADLHMLLEQLTQLVESGAVLEGVAGLPHNAMLQVQLFASLFLGNAPSARFPRQLEMFATIARGMSAGKVGPLDQETMVKQYCRGHELTQAKPEIDEILERYLLNEAFGGLFPWGYSSPYQHYQRLVVCFGIIRWMLASVAAAYDRSPTAEEAVQVIQVFSRLYQHNRQFTENVEGLLERCGWNSLHKLYMVLK